MTCAPLPLIDAAIDANRAELVRRYGMEPGPCAYAWQRAWDKHPDLKAIDDALWDERADVTGDYFDKWLMTRKPVYLEQMS